MAEPISGIFYCVALIIYMLWFDMCRAPRDLSAWSVLWWALSAVVCVIAVIISVLFKETGITILAIIFGLSAISLTASIVRLFSNSDNQATHGDKTMPGPIHSDTSTSCSSDNTHNEIRSSGLTITTDCVQDQHRHSPERNTVWVCNHLAWMVLAVGIIIGYFVFRAQLVSPSRPTATEAGGNVEDATWLSFLQQMVSAVSATSSMLIRLVLGAIFPSLRDSTAASTSSFYLDESQLIRKAENPFAFLNPTEKAYSVLYLHFRYFYLLLWPQELCSEYAFDCIPKVTSWTDEGRYRLLYPLVMYASLLITVIYGLKKVLVPSPVRGRLDTDDAVVVSLHAETSSLPWTNDAPYCILIEVLLLIVPFIPASGVRLCTLFCNNIPFLSNISYHLYLMTLIARWYRSSFALELFLRKDSFIFPQWAIAT